MIRWLYSRLLALHPPHFRERFAGEMLWIFDQEGSSGANRLIADAAVSLVRQWFLRSDLPETRRAGARWDGVPLFYTAPSDGPRRSALAEGALGALALMLGLFFLMTIGGTHPNLLSTGMPGRPGVAGSGTQQWSIDAATQVVAGVADASKPDVVFKYFQALTVLKALDVNQDLTISSDEMARAPEALRALDRDQDGKLSAEECGFAPSGETLKPEDIARQLREFDVNHDGLLEDKELPASMRPLLDRAAGQKADGYLPVAVAAMQLEAELKKSRVWFFRVHRVLEALDADHDHEISPAEIAASAAALRTLDRNGDGRLTAQELLPDMVTNALAIYIVRWDVNGDGQFSTAEIAMMPVEVREVVESARHETDGSVTEAELEKQLRRRAYFDSDDGRNQLRLAADAKARGKGSPAETQRR
jgi:Ca2+-binding EF-hand superfamily protein